MTPMVKPMRAQNLAIWSGLQPGTLVLVDTAPFIYVLEDHPVWAPQFVGLFEAAAQGLLNLALSTVTLAEVLTGPYKAQQPALARRYQNALESYLVQPLTASIAALSAQMRAQYRLKLPDAVQVATALDIGATALVTHDRDFSAVRGLAVLDGSQASA
jgi:predicted nucleic acid-binding protein